MKQIQPLHLKQKYFKEVEREINKLFYEIIYKPLIRILKTPRKSVLNALDDVSTLTKAIESGRIWYDHGRGEFQGEFNSHISRDLRSLGAKYNKRKKAWLFSGVLPSAISTAQVSALAEFDGIKRLMITVLDNIDIDHINDISDIPEVYGKTIKMMEDDFQKSINRIVVSPKLTQEASNIIAAEWGQNLDLYIKEWTSKNIIDLRKAISENTFAGKRSSHMIGYIRDNFGVSKRKATFLARQETSLLMGKFRETRYKAIGINKYRWSGAMDSRERADHKRLEGKVYTWDTPPIINTETGKRGHPSEDFGCRCVAIALIE